MSTPAFGTPPPRHPLRDALTGTQGETPEPMALVTGVVTAVDNVSAPRTVTVRLADGTTLAPLPYLGWWAPRVNDVAYLLKQGPVLFVLGGLAGLSLVVTNPTPPAPPVPPPPPTPPPTTRTVNVQPVWMGSYKPGGSEWYPNDIRQGGPNYTGLWYYGGQIAAAKGSGTIIAASVYMRRSATSHGVNGGANVRLGVHNGSGPGAGFSLAAVEVRGQLGKGQDANVPLTAGQIGGLNGGWTGLALAPGNPSFTSPDYLRADSGGPSGALTLTIQG